MNQTKPPMQASDEATKDELDLAREQGRELNKALNHMVSQVADDGQEKQVDYPVSYGRR
ncbi:MAG: hypothetical protein H6661_13590 [Ardenticatenaceae bacterium]|nr:hypothetical protein [Ardenticatenaceae bacterium]